MPSPLYQLISNYRNGLSGSGVNLTEPSGRTLEMTFLEVEGVWDTVFPLSGLLKKQPLNEVEGVHGLSEEKDGEFWVAVELASTRAVYLRQVTRHPTTKTFPFNNPKPNNFKSNRVWMTVVECSIYLLQKMKLDGRDEFAILAQSAPNTILYQKGRIKTPASPIDFNFLQCEKYVDIVELFGGARGGLPTRLRLHVKTQTAFDNEVQAEMPDLPSMPSFTHYLKTPEDHNCIINLPGEIAYSTTEHHEKKNVFITLPTEHSSEPLKGHLELMPFEMNLAAQQSFLANIFYPPNNCCFSLNRIRINVGETCLVVPMYVNTCGTFVFKFEQFCAIYPAMSNKVTLFEWTIPPQMFNEPENIVKSNFLVECGKHNRLLLKVKWVPVSFIS